MYKLIIDASRIVAVENPDGGSKMSGHAAKRVPKLYLVSDRGEPLYVGVTKQPLRHRLRGGFAASGTNGYYGYSWRHNREQVNIDVWLQEGGDGSLLDVETVEAEVAFLIRQERGQWPTAQTEIHFRPSDDSHRAAARLILEGYLH